MRMVWVRETGRGRNLKQCYETSERGSVDENQTMQDGAVVGFERDTMPGRTRTVRG